ncbi:hypothetical protein [Campylobacter jejuni]|uniref:hypothetical protein n=1 Tax=Campylobacter jejuni TaxID=197 RepID=UPI0020A4B166|nr:hypothetical protein [Campylobacter jejuni]UTD44865.1 hypothetical protein FORC84_p003 [Campylobacter jejuni]
MKLDHAENFLNYKTIIGMKRESIKGIENTLSLFYRYLSKHECLPNVPSTSFDSYINTDGKEVPISPFNNVILPSKDTTSIEHTFPIEYIPVLFELASIIAKPITLGLYLQIFGGLRIGEVVNIKRSSIKHQVNAEVIVINLVERNLRTDIKDASGSNYVKKPRKQQIFILRDWFDSLYKDHLELYKSTDGSGALFVNRDGKAMSAKSYRQYFDKVKKEFIKILKNSSKIDDKLLAHHLKVTKWSTQIGRGIFSNLLAEYAENPYDIAVPRGDDSLLSSLTYLKGTVRYRDKLLERLNNMHTNYIPSLLDESTKVRK